METGADRAPLRTLSIVAPVYNEGDNVRPLVEGIVTAVRPMGRPFEVIVVDDGSADLTLSHLRDLVASVPELVVIALRRNFGQTLALQAGLDRTRGDAVVTMDGDLQNDPEDIPQMIAALEAGADVVSGWRRQRQDTLVVRKIPSWIANRLIRWVTRVPIHDQGCSLKAYRREVIEALDLYGDMHRFIAVLTLPVGADLVEVEVRHHARVAGVSKYGLSRIFKVIADLLTLQMITRFRERPLRWFATLGAPFAGAAIALAAVAVFSDARPMIIATCATLMALTAFSCFMFGLASELWVESGGTRDRSRIVFRKWGRIG